MEKYIYSYFNHVLYRSTEKEFNELFPGYGYRKGFGFILEGANPSHVYYDYGVDGILTEEEAKQFIRDHYHEEPVNFYEPARSYKEWEKTHPSAETIKEKLGFERKN